MRKGFILGSILLLVCFSSTNIFGKCIQGDCKNGQGTFTYPDGREYIGEWKDGKKHGYGTMTSPDGSKYVGKWKDDKRDGQGTIIYPDGKKWVGRVKDGKPAGR